MQVKQYSLSIN